MGWKMQGLGVLWGGSAAGSTSSKVCTHCHVTSCTLHPQENVHLEVPFSELEGSSLIKRLWVGPECGMGCMVGPGLGIMDKHKLLKAHRCARCRELGHPQAWLHTTVGLFSSPAPCCRGLEKLRHSCPALQRKRTLNKHSQQRW
jgi:hypothetical protein